MTQPISVYQRGALAWLGIRRKAKTDPNFTPLLKPETFIRSESWRSMKRRTGLVLASDIREFLRGFYDASQVKAGGKDDLA